MTRNPPESPRFAANPTEPVFNLESVRPPRSSQPRNIPTDRDFDEEETLAFLNPRRNPRRTLVRLVGYLLIGTLFWATANLLTQRPIREAVLSWTTFGLTRQAHAVAEYVENVVALWRKR